MTCVRVNSYVCLCVVCVMCVCVCDSVYDVCVRLCVCMRVCLCDSLCDSVCVCDMCVCSSHLLSFAVSLFVSPSRRKSHENSIGDLIILQEVPEDMEHARLEKLQQKVKDIIGDADSDGDGRIR